MGTRVDRRRRRRTSPLTREAAEIAAAIDLVAAGVARTVRLASLPDVERLAMEGARMAATIGVAVTVERGSNGHATLIVGPRLTAPADRT
jgi:hypothetical protein